MPNFYVRKVTTLGGQSCAASRAKTSWRAADRGADPACMYYYALYDIRTTSLIPLGLIMLVLLPRHYTGSTASAGSIQRRS